MVKGYRKLPEEQRFNYFHGASNMYNAFARAMDEGVEFEKAVERLGVWIDELRRWGRDEIAIAAKYRDGRPLPPYIERWPDGD
jgi:hypothetical protein